jgi:hypothetical protein
MSFVLDHDRPGPSGRPTLRLKAPVQQNFIQSRQRREARVIEFRPKGAKQVAGSAPARAKAAALKWLKATYPAFKQSRPLMLGVYDLIAPAAEKAGIPAVSLRAAIAMHVASRRYLVACAKPGSRRHDLSGKPHGRLADEHRKHAADRLATLPARRR